MADLGTARSRLDRGFDPALEAEAQAHHTGLNEGSLQARRKPPLASLASACTPKHQCDFSILVRQIWWPDLRLPIASTRLPSPAPMVWLAVRFLPCSDGI